MNTKSQYKLMIAIADRIIEKVKSYISECNALDEETCVWVDWDACEVIVGKAGETHKGDEIPINDFIFESSEGLMPDYDLIDTYAATEWRSHRK
ncbi:MAG: hypothetical protein J5702_03840 [Bacteroidales bacterium]|nr:hypothetical protein [Bacteroidales bacterium]